MSNLIISDYQCKELIFADPCEVRWGEGVETERSPIAPAGFLVNTVCLLEDHTEPGEEESVHGVQPGEVLLHWADAGAWSLKYLRAKPRPDLHGARSFEITDPAVVDKGGPTIIRIFEWDSDECRARQKKLGEIMDAREHDRPMSPADVEPLVWQAMMELNGEADRMRW